MKTLIAALSVLALTSCGSAQEIEAALKGSKTDSNDQSGSTEVKAPKEEKKEAAAVKPKDETASAVKEEVKEAVAVPEVATSTVEADPTPVPEETPDPDAKKIVDCAPGSHGGVVVYVVARRVSPSSYWFEASSHTQLNDAKNQKAGFISRGTLATNLKLGRQYVDHCVTDIAE